MNTIKRKRTKELRNKIKPQTKKGVNKFLKLNRRVEMDIGLLFNSKATKFLRQSFK